MIIDNIFDGRTQIPQFILDDPTVDPKTVNILVAQPRRISAMSLAQRVAEERIEKLGETVGYSVRLDHRFGERTRLLFCTTGVLLRRLTTDTELKGVTHIVLDEVHERDLESDFLLLILREALLERNDLRVVIMSATLQVDLFSDYFRNFTMDLENTSDGAINVGKAALTPQCISIEGRTFAVSEFYLDEIIKETEFMESESASNSSDGKDCVDEVVHGEENGFDGVQEEGDKVDKTQCLKCSKYFSFMEWFYHVENCTGKSASITNQGQTSFDIKSERNCNPFLDPFVASKRDNSQEKPYEELDYTITLEEKEDKEDRDSFEDVARAVITAATEDNTRAHRKNDRQHQVDANRPLSALERYLQRINEDEIDAELIVRLIERIMGYQDEICTLISTDKDLSSDEFFELESIMTGSILVFLPGWEEILNVKTALENSFIREQRLWILPLHSAISPRDQQKVFRHPPEGRTKIILSTNIAETSVTIDDVAYVIDTGKVKQKSFDAYTGCSTLRSQWISKASARQRAGRSGRIRPGICYHLFSRQRNKALEEFTVPEIRRTSLEELCLKVKLLNIGKVFTRVHKKISSMNSTNAGEIEKVLSLALEPPSSLSVKRALQLLVDIGAIEIVESQNCVEENLTSLGCCLALLPMSPRFGKAILYGMLFRCLDPVLTACCAASYKNPFILPASKNDKAAAAAAKRSFAGGHESDHIATLGAVNGFLRTILFEHIREAVNFCNRNYLSYPTMCMIIAIREQVLEELVRFHLLSNRAPCSIRFASDLPRGPLSTISLTIGGTSLNENSNKIELVMAALSAGFYPCIARVNGSDMRQPSNTKVCVRGDLKASVMKSINEKIAHENKSSPMPTRWMIYEEMSGNRNGKLMLRDTTVIPSVALLLSTGVVRRENRKSTFLENVLEVDDEETLEEYQEYVENDIDVENIALEEAYLKESNQHRQFRKHFSRLMQGLQDETDSSLRNFAHPVEYWHILSFIKNGLVDGHFDVDIARSECDIKFIFDVLETDDFENPGDAALICVDEWIALQSDKHTAVLLKTMRLTLESLFQIFVKYDFQQFLECLNRHPIYNVALETFFQLLQFEVFGEIASGREMLCVTGSHHVKYIERNAWKCTQRFDAGFDTSFDKRQGGQFRGHTRGTRGRQQTPNHGRGCEKRRGRNTVVEYDSNRGRAAKGGRGSGRRGPSRGSGRGRGRGGNNVSAPEI